jgi:hypothetical protein
MTRTGQKAQEVARQQQRPGLDYAGFAPFGFGYRRCPGEQLTINVFEDFRARCGGTRSSL